MISTKDYSVASDYICIFLYILTNFSFAGVFRVLMKYADISPAFVVFYKFAIISSSMCYVIIGFRYLKGED